MCAPTQLYTGLSSAIGLVSSIAKDKRDEKISEYKTQIAINNIENKMIIFLFFIVTIYLRLILSVKIWKKSVF